MEECNYIINLTRDIFIVKFGSSVIYTFFSGLRTLTLLLFTDPHYLNTMRE